MADRDDLVRSTAPREAGAAFCAARVGGFAMVEPLTARATAWLQARVGAEPTWVGERLAIEPRYFPVLADAIIDAGFLFERDALPN
jgi:hypothetical protein